MREGEREREKSKSDENNGEILKSALESPMKPCDNVRFTVAIMNAFNRCNKVASSVKLSKLNPVCVCVGSTHVAAMTTSSVVTGWVRERSWPLLRRLSTAAFRERTFGGPPSMLFSNSCMGGGGFQTLTQVWLDGGSKAMEKTGRKVPYIP